MGQLRSSVMACMTGMKRTVGAVLLIICQLQTSWGNNNDSSVEGPPCEPLPDEYAACKAISNRRSTHYYRHILPDIQNDISGHVIDIGLAIVQQFNPPPPQECIDIAFHIMCLVAVPPCDPETGLPMPVCNGSCVAYEKLIRVDYCRDLDDNIRRVRQSSTFPDLRILVDKYFNIDCYNSSTYIFEPNVTTFSSQNCTHLFTPNNLEQILSRPSCQQVPPGLCSSLAETGYYVQVPDRNASALMESFASVNTSLLLSCQTGLLKLSCDYYYPPCHPMTFQQIPICVDSCDSVSLIQTSCPSMIIEDNMELNIPSETLSLDCFNPSSFLVKDVTVSQEKCIDLSAYDVVALSVGLSVGVAFITLLSILIFTGCLIWVYKKRTKEKFNPLMARCSKKNGEASVDLHYVDTSNTDESGILKLSKADKESYASLFASVLVSHTDVVKDEIIGQGAFGKVYSGELFHSQGSGKKLLETVAIKTIKNVSSHDELKAFFAESLIMKDFNHPNVLSLTGVCFDTPDGYPYLILPFMVNGSLKDYLKKQRVHVTDVDTCPKGLEQSILTRMCMDVSCGMEYLAGKKFVHRDLAARNCMVDDDLRIKVGDFGLARDVYHSDYYRVTDKNAKLPVKWMSPEAVHDNISNEKTDVWSFGVTCWEIFSLGRTPYPSIANHELVKLISSGIKLEKPNLCPLQIYSVIAHCWELLPSDRPTFAELSSQFSDYWEEHHAYS